MTSTILDGDGSLPRTVSSPHASSAGGDVQRYIDAHRQEGHRYAVLDPMGSAAAPDLADLAPARFGLAPSDALSGCDGAWPEVADVQALDAGLKAAYCGTLALDASAVRDAGRRAWLYRRMEERVAPSAAIDGRRLLDRLIQAQAWEQHVADRHADGKRFSLEGCESLIPLLDALIEAAAARGIGRLFMGMPHRGRVNVLVNVLGMPAHEVLDYFEAEPADPSRHRDLVYHLGARCAVVTPRGSVDVTLAHNPSHLQSVYPVVLGMAHAAQADQPPPRRAQAALALALHGDAAFAGQGVVMETLALTQRPGYTVGGTVHVVINNQIGFTEPNPMCPRTARYATDVTRMVDAPVLRVNADAPEQLQRAAVLAVDYRMAFGADVVIDLIGYRRPGHSEHDVPMVTSPRRYSTFAHMPSVVDVYAAALASAGTASDAEMSAFIAARRAAAHARFEASSPRSEPVQQAAAGTERRAPWSRKALQAALATMTKLPAGFTPHAMVRELVGAWQQAARVDGASADWCLAENLAYASLLLGGIDVRVSGLDVQRGTFMHRHAVWHNQTPHDDDHDQFVPLQQLPAAARFEVVNSVLSEEAVVGFEYGYSVQAPRTLTVWEAQFGDFVNGAQVFIDQYISAGEEKWGCESALTLLLPHGYEGVGPEHSNAHLARFLSLCGGDNLRVAYPSTAAQLFHLLRQQALSAQKKPLVVMTPKATLYKEAGSHSPVAQLLDGAFMPVLPDSVGTPQAEATRVVLCSGKLYYALERARREQGRSDVALLRLEQLYPFPSEALVQALCGHGGMRRLVWAQEETLNQGAWLFIRDDLAACLPEGVQLECVSRPATASGATSSYKVHRQQQQELVQRVLGSR